MFEKRLKLLVLIVAALGACSALFAYGEDAWHIAGWRTPAQVDAAVAVVDAKTQAAMAEMADFRTEYKCDKLKAEIARVRELLPTVAAAAELERLARIYEREDCAKYEAF
jgi:hypothetical protein